MSSLFKNPNYVLTVLGSSSNHERNHVVTVNSGLAQFDHAQSNSKKWPICPEQFFFCTNHYYYFNLPIGSFHCAKFKKILTADPELWDVPFLGPKWSICPKQNFFGKIIKVILIYLLLPFIVQNSSSGSRVVRMHSFGPKMAHFPNEIFFRKPVNEPCFFHSCLSTC